MAPPVHLSHPAVHNATVTSPTLPSHPVDSPPPLQIANAKQQAATILAKARAQVLRTGRASQGAEVLEATLRTLGGVGAAAPAPAGEDVLPKAVMKRWVVWVMMWVLEWCGCG